MSAAGVDPALTARFVAALGTIWAERQRPAEWKLAIAVSGGPDSLALLLLAAAAFPGRVEAATVDHRLRAESADEAAMVARVCAGLGVPHAVLPVSVDLGNVQAQARAARYAALAGWMGDRGLSALLTAHHADDQAETLLMRLNRGSGLAGVAGVRARGTVPGIHDAPPLLRPLLGWRRAELAGIVSSAGLVAADDPSNVDDRFDRVRMRKALAGADWLDIAAIAESAGHLADADAALDWATAREWAECVEQTGLGITYCPQAPRAVALRVIAQIVAKLEGEAPRGGAVARVFDALLAGQPASIGNLVARASLSGWVFTPAPRRAAGPRTGRP